MKVDEKFKGLIEKAENLIAELKEQIKSENVESSRFKKLVDGWVLDKALNIEWGPSSDKEMTFEEANKYAADVGGRLPTVKELRSWVDYDRYDPAIDTQFFKDTKSGWYWTGTLYAPNPSILAWCVSFNSGSVGGNYKGYRYYVRPVRPCGDFVL